MNTPYKIVYITDKKFLYLTSVSIYSLMAHANPQERYHLVLIVDGVPLYLQSMLSQMVAPHPSFTLEFIDSSTLTFPHCNSPLYPSIHFICFSLPQIFAEDDKVLCIDGDTIVLDDVAKIFAVDMDDCYLAACVDHPMAYLMASDRVISREYVGLTFKEYFTTIVGLEEADLPHYVNVGVSMWNLKKMREDRMGERFVSRSQERIYLQPIQDTMFPLIKNAVCTLPARWNYMPFWEGEYPDYVAGERAKAKADPAIIHFGRGNRPWEKTGVDFEEYFWKYATGSPFGPMLHNAFGINQMNQLWDKVQRLAKGVESLGELTMTLNKEVASLKGRLRPSS